MSVCITGIAWFYGPPNRGKTIAAITASNDPSKIAFLDGDVGKGAWIHEQNKLAAYHDLVQEAGGMDDLKFHEYFIKLVEGLPSGLDLIVADNVWRAFPGAHSYVVENSSEFRHKYAPSGAIKGAQQWQDTKKVHLPNLYRAMLDKARLVIFVTHEKADRDDAGVATGKMAPDGDRSLEIASGFTVRLAKNTRKASPVPVGLVIKKPRAHLDIKSGVVAEIFPDRVPEFNWSAIRGYIESPVGLRELLPEETPDEFESRLISGALSPEEEKVYALNRALAQMKLQEHLAQEVLLAYSKTKAPNKMLAANKIAAQLTEQFPDITPADVIAVLDAANESQREE